MRSTQLFALAVTAAALLVTTSTRAAVKISSKPTHNMNCSAGVCTPTAKKAVLNVNNLAAMLGSGDVKISSGSLAQDIEIDSAVIWASGQTLTLDAYHSIAFNSPLSVTGQGGLTITTNDGGSGGDFRFSDKGQAQFWDMNSSLIINGNSYILVNTLGQLAADVNKNATARYALAANLDASIDGTYDEAPITKIFGGTFEGLGNSISNLTIVSRRHRRTQDSMVGLFAEIYGGSVRDLAMINTTVDGGDEYSNIVLLVGTLAGVNEGSVAFVRSDNSTVSAGLEARVGGLVGRNGGRIVYSSARGKVSGTQSNAIGGLAGESDGPIATSSADVSVSGTSIDWAGGLVGASGLTIDRSYATGSVTSDGFVGGLVGEAMTVSNSYATGAVTSTGSDYAGGLIGKYYGPVSTSYSTGKVTLVSGEAAGGLIGFDANVSAIADCYWDLDSSGIDNPAQGAGNVENDPGIKGLTTAQFGAKLPKGFDRNIWRERAGVNNGYPYLIDLPPG